MNMAEAARLLSACAAYDRRTIGDVDVMAWHKALGGLEFTDALEGVSQHYTRTKDWIMPSDVIAEVKIIRAERERQRRSRNLALPSRFEDDAERDSRLARGIEACREAIHCDEPEPTTAHERALHRARKMHGRPQQQPRRRGPNSDKVPTRAEFGPPANEDVAALARQYLADGHSPESVADRLWVSVAWLRRAAADRRSLPAATPDDFGVQFRREA